MSKSASPADTGATSDDSSRIEIARALALICVFYVHALHGVIDLFDQRWMYWLAVAQVKVLSPHVAVFFALAGMTSRSLGAKPWTHVAKRSLMLLLLAFASHVVGVLIQHALWTPWPSPVGLARELLRPALHGSGHSTFIPWFFVALAAARVFGYAWSRGWRAFMSVLAAAAAIIALSQWIGLSRDFYYWQTWPATTAMFLLGMYVRDGWRVPHPLGTVCLFAMLTLPVVNRPGLWADGVCLTCEAEFTSQPVLGAFGFAPLYFLLELFALVGWLWLAQAVATSPLRALLVYIGRNSMQFLLLHGWVLLTVYAYAGVTVRETGLIARFSGLWMFPATLIALVVLHLLLYRVASRPINSLVGLCTAVSGRSVTLLRRLPLLR
jgi:hypothetical protein